MSDEVARAPWSFFPYAWHQATWQRLTTLAQESRLPHALLVGGPAGIGKHRLAQAFSAWLLCQVPTAAGACGHCKSCSLLNAGSHPDLLELGLETNDKGKLKQAIGVDQVRAVVDFAVKSSQLGGYRIVMVEPAHLMNVSSSNALLKTLEEPGRQTLILLLSSQALTLSATVRSRCQKLLLGTPPAEEALAWLAPQLRDAATARLLLDLADGAPLAALTLRDSLWFPERERLLKDLAGLSEGRLAALAVAQRWHALGAEAVLPALVSLCEDIARQAAGAVVVKHRDLAPIIGAVARRSSPAAVLAFCQGLAEKQRLLAGNVAGSSLLDAAFSEWKRLPAAAAQ
ncbi:MAG: polymerase subunit delta [Moraxellaceae bacterium]|jgi:DNA polymerase-3 subunit delta'|nr:polymerase subunit delta [Moraxellaceae bacterium]